MINPSALHYAASNGWSQEDMLYFERLQIIRGKQLSVENPIDCDKQGNSKTEKGTLFISF